MTTELIKRLRQHADTFEKSGFAVDGLVRDYREAADTIQELSEKPEQEPCEDCIRREDALMALTGEWTESRDEILSLAIRRIKALPPVKPQYTEAEIQKMQELFDNMREEIVHLHEWAFDREGILRIIDKYRREISKHECI